MKIRHLQAGPRFISLRTKLLVSLTLVAISLTLYTAVASYHLANERVMDISKRLSSQTTTASGEDIADAVSLLHTSSTRFIKESCIHEIASRSFISSKQRAVSTDELSMYTLEMLNPTKTNTSFDLVATYLTNGFTFETEDTAWNFNSYESCITALSYQPNSDKVIRTFLYEYITAITNEALNMGLTIEQMEDCATSILHLFQKANTTDCLADISTLTHNLIQRIQSQKETNSSLLISCAKEYISQNIQNPLLDLERVSNHIGISRIYFCKLFHQVEGISFSTYLKNERLNLAKKLLRTTNLKVFEISDACGFATAKYFSYAFKQSVGQIPLEYRKNNASNKENYL